jgi:hypothetical protein
MEIKCFTGKVRMESRVVFQKKGAKKNPTEAGLKVLTYGI